MGKQSAPAAPNPQATAAAQTASNRETAITQAGLNMVNQTDAAGNKQSWNQIGTWADGTPRYETTQTLSPKSQGIYEAGLGTQKNLASLAQQKSGELGGLLANPINFDQQKAYLESLTSGALDKSWDRQQSSLDQRLSNQGIKLGSDAYTRATNDFGVTRSDAYNSANVNNYNTALQSQMALRQAPINEILALAGQGSVASPQFTATPQTGVAGTDVAGITQAGYNNQVNAVNQANQQTGQMFGGLFSAGASLAPLFFSDERLKKNVKPMRMKLADVPLKSWEWKDGSGKGVGVMAQDVEKKHPEMVDNSHPSGFKRVNYGGLMRMGGR